MKKNSTIVLSLLMIGFSLIAMPTYAHADTNRNYDESNNYYKDSDKFLDIKNAKIGIHDDIIKKIFIETRDEIPQDGSKGAFGYGAILADGTAIATETHEGLLDSEIQKDVNDPKFHNHFVEITTNEFCRDKGKKPGLAVADLTLESPGDVIIDKNKVILKNLPESAPGLFPSVSDEEITPGSDMPVVASFTLRTLVDLTDKPPSVAKCIEDVQSIDPSYVLRGDIVKFDEEYQDENNYNNKEPRY